MDDCESCRALGARLLELQDENGRLREAMRAPPFNYPTLGLTALEARALVALHTAAPRVVTRTDMRDAIHGAGSGVEIDNKRIDVCLSKLRRKLQGIGVAIIAERSQGWRLNEHGLALIDTCATAGEL